MNPLSATTPVSLGFGDRLYAAMREHGPVCVGIDPHASLLAQWGLDEDANGVREFSLRVVEALGGRAAAFKPQAAFFERHGSRGVAVLEEVIAACREVGTLCIVDAKRGDIGSTMAGYAEAFLSDQSPLAGDAVTLSPYLGVGSLTPKLPAKECLFSRSPPTLRERPSSTRVGRMEAASQVRSCLNWRTLIAPVINSILALQASSSERPLVMLCSVSASICLHSKARFWLQEWARRVLVQRRSGRFSQALRTLCWPRLLAQFWARVRVWQDCATPTLRRSNHCNSLSS